MVVEKPIGSNKKCFTDTKNALTNDMDHPKQFNTNKNQVNSPISFKKFRQIYIK